MIAEYKVRTNVGIGLGFIVQLLPMLAPNLFAQIPVLGPLCGWGGMILFIYGCSCYAMGKGHAWAWGLLGLFSLIGLIVLALMTDKAKAGEVQELPQQEAPEAPAPPGDSPQS
ncbi:MAG: hypothetical protein PHV33_13485 [Elusimicrobiales bacterium]|nr:hypothetical protein [Elusimicrobiales bacterium]